jgi:hypothetical protein
LILILILGFGTTFQGELMKKADRISIWAFGAAPDDLRKLYEGEVVPTWLALVPKGIHDTHIDHAILVQSGAIFRHETGEGDFVYAGCNSMSEGLIALTPRDSATPVP